MRAATRVMRLFVETATIVNVAGCAVDYSVKENPGRTGGAVPDTADTAADVEVDTTNDTATDTALDTAEDNLPDTGVPDTGVPDTGVPDTGVPDTDVPETGDTGGDFDIVDCATSSKALGCSADVGPGRLFLWGDEHVLFTDHPPASDAFWAATLAYLADLGGTTPRTTVDATGVDFYSSVIQDAAAALGLTMARGGDIVLRSAVSVDIVIADELAAGKAVMLVANGYGDSECLALAAATMGLPLTFRCPDEVWGPVGTLAPHPITDTLGLDAFPFVNGRYVVDLGVQPTALVAQE